MESKRKDSFVSVCWVALLITQLYIVSIVRTHLHAQTKQVMYLWLDYKRQMVYGEYLSMHVSDPAGNCSVCPRLLLFRFYFYQCVHLGVVQLCVYV